jgi:hypothetical protein
MQWVQEMQKECDLQPETGQAKQHLKLLYQLDCRFVAA